MKACILLPVVITFAALASCEAEKKTSGALTISEINVSVPQEINIQFLADLNRELVAKLPGVQVFATVNGSGGLIFVEPESFTESDHKMVRDVYVGWLQSRTLRQTPEIGPGAKL